MNTEYMELVLIPILVGVLEAIKKTGFNSKFIPTLSILLGVLIGVVYSGFDLKEGILAGVFIGLSAVGLYSGVKHTKIGIKGLKD